MTLDRPPLPASAAIPVHGLHLGGEDPCRDLAAHPRPGVAGESEVEADVDARLCDFRDAVGEAVEAVHDTGHEWCGDLEGGAVAELVCQHGRGEPLSVLWADGYSWNGGVASNGCQLGSAIVAGLPSVSACWMAVIGRQVS